MIDFQAVDDSEGPAYFAGCRIAGIVMSLDDWARSSIRWWPARRTAQTRALTVLRTALICGTRVRRRYRTLLLERKRRLRVSSTGTRTWRSSAKAMTRLL